MNMKTTLPLALVLLAACAPAVRSESPEAASIRAKIAAIPLAEKVNISNAEWVKVLTAEQYNILRESGTEPPFRNEYWNNHEKGIFVCRACGNPLFDSQTKFESGTGWPSFYAPLAPDRVDVSKDNTLGMTRDEVSCARCGGHLGHVFDDGPAPTHLRYCLDSASIKLEKK